MLAAADLSPEHTDTLRDGVLVLGAGPAGLAITASLAERGTPVACRNPTLPPPWPNQYGLWRDELEHIAEERRDPELLRCTSGHYARPVV